MTTSDTIKKVDGCLSSIVALILGFVGFGVGFSCGQSLIRKQAVDYGAAEWRADPKTGELEFVWLTDKSEKKDQ